MERLYVGWRKHPPAHRILKAFVKWEPGDSRPVGGEAEAQAILDAVQENLWLAKLPAEAWRAGREN